MTGDLAALQYETFVRLPFADELAELPATYQAALAQDVDELAAWLRAGANGPLLVVSCGGSMTAASLVVDLHQRSTGHLAKSVTPTELATYGVNPASGSGLFITAGGSNADAIATVRRLRSADVPWAVMAGKTGSAVVSSAVDGAPRCFAFDLLPDRHGWVSVNATLAQAVVLAHAFAVAYPELGPLPSSIAPLLPEAAGSIQAAITGLADKLAVQLTKDRLLCVFTPAAATFAADIESKFAEGGLGFLQLSDLRNFAHGRYQTILADPTRCALLVVHSAKESDYVAHYIAAFPPAVPLAQLTLPSTSAVEVQVGAVVAALVVTGAIGVARGLEPGWGSVCEFGDAIYELAIPSDCF